MRMKFLNDRLNIKKRKLVEKIKTADDAVKLATKK